MLLANFGAFIAIFCGYMSMYCAAQNSREDGPCQYSFDGIKISHTFTRNALRLLPISHRVRPANLVISPFGFDVTLAELASGAEDETRRQLINALTINDLDTDIPKGYREIFACMQQLQKQQRKRGAFPSSTNDAFSVTTSLFVDKNIAVKSDFPTKIQNFDSNIRPVDLSKREAGKSINNLLFRLSKGSAKDVIPLGSMKAGNQLISASGIGASCELPWTKSKAYFTLRTGKEVLIDVLQADLITARYKEFHNIGARGLYMPCGGDNNAIMVLMPFNAKGMRTMIEKLKNAKHQDIFQGLYNAKVNVSLPVINMKSRWDLKPLLNQIRARDVISSKAKLGSVSSQPGLKLDNAFQVAFSKISQGKQPLPAKPNGELDFSLPGSVRFDIDRPFAYFMVKLGPTKMNRVNSPVFVSGVVYDPRSAY